MMRTSSGVGVAAALALTLLAIVAVGCAAVRAADPSRDDMARSTSATPQPASWPSTATAEAMTAMRALAHSYVSAAQVGERARMRAAYLPDTRRAAVTVIARDLELARPGAPLSGLNTYRSLAIVRGSLWPPSLAPRIRSDDASRLLDLTSAHEQAAIVLMQLEDGSEHLLFAVQDSGETFLVP
jgi:hypothetical protein